MAKDFRRVYVWELPVRIFHWINALAIVILTGTGFVIANPPVFLSSAEASNSYWFGYIRMIHFVTAYVMIANILFRLYWAFAGNRFANWKEFIPFTKKGFRNFWYVLRVDVFLMPDKTHRLSNISVGHNSVAAFSYFLMFILVIIQVGTGFGLFADNASWFLPKFLGSIGAIFGNNIKMRFMHHMLTWIFLAFVVIHVYLVLYHDYVEARGETSSMLSGFKFILRKRIKGSSEDEMFTTES